MLLRLPIVKQSVSTQATSRAWLRTLRGEAVDARADLDVPQKTAERGSMKLFLAYIHLQGARLSGPSGKKYPGCPGFRFQLSGHGNQSDSTGGSIHEPWHSGVSAERRHYPGRKSAALCRDAATKIIFMANR
jgi:hypothetical protein